MIEYIKSDIRGEFKDGIFLTSITPDRFPKLPYYPMAIADCHTFYLRRKQDKAVQHTLWYIDYVLKNPDQMIYVVPDCLYLSNKPDFYQIINKWNSNLKALRKPRWLVPLKSESLSHTNFNSVGYYVTNKRLTLQDIPKDTWVHFFSKLSPLLPKLQELDEYNNITYDAIQEL